MGVVIEWIRTFTGMVGLNVTDAQAIALAIATVLVPLTTQVLKKWVASYLVWDRKDTAIRVLVFAECVLLSAVALGAAAFFQTAQWDWKLVLAPTPAMFTISQLAYALSGMPSLQERLDNE